MTKFGQFIMGPAGSGKTTYCKALFEHNKISKSGQKVLRLVNLDPGCEDISSETYPKSQINKINSIKYDIDIRELITIEDVMENFAPKNFSQNDEDMDIDDTNVLKIPVTDKDNDNTQLIKTKKVRFVENNKMEATDNINAENTNTMSNFNDACIGPNGALIYCMEYLARDNFCWLREQIEQSFIDDDYILFDCPGQIELYMHIPIMKSLIKHLINFCNFRICGVFLIDSTNVYIQDDIHKYFGQTLTSLAVMINFEDIPFVNAFTKMDLVSKKHGLFEKDKKSDANLLVDEEKDLIAGDFEIEHEVSDTDEEIDEFRPTSLVDSTNDLSVPSLELFEYLYDAQGPPRRDQQKDDSFSNKLDKLTKSLASVIDSYDLLKFHHLNLNSRSSLDSFLYHIDTALQYDDERDATEKIYHGAEQELEHNPFASNDTLGDNITSSAYNRSNGQSNGEDILNGID